MNDFLPAIVSVDILAAFFTHGFRIFAEFDTSTLRKLEQTRLQSTIDGDNREPLV